MFTGIVEDLGIVERVVPGAGGGKALTVRTSLDPKTIGIGDSICHDGVCLTVVKLEGQRYTVEAGPETLARTTIGELSAGSRVNLERSMALGARIGGHLVQGHVDGTGTVCSVVARENAHDITIEAPAELGELIAPRGSIAVDGISLTVTGVDGPRFSISIIPHTFAVTTIAAKKAGARVNLEADMIARYVARVLEARGLGTGGGGAGGGSGGVTRELLETHGYLR